LKRAILFGVTCLLLLVPAIVPGQELSTDVFPSEDELLEALILGDIDYDQYILLLDIARCGIDSTNLYLLDLVPNLSSLSDRGRKSILESDQQELFIAAKEVRMSKMRYTYYRTLDSKEQSRYRIDGRVRASEGWTARFAVRKELSGRERFVGRSLVHKRDHGLIRKLTFGSITERYGLGTVIGYREKLLKCRAKLDGESFLFPDNGGFNGAAIDLQRQHWRVRSMVSYTRDSAVDLRTLAGMAELTRGSIRPYVTVGVSRIGNRISGKSLSDIKMAGGCAGRYHNGNATVEYCVQTGAKRESGNLLAEGTHRISGTRLQYAGWWYGDNYIDLASGGRAADIRTQIDLPDVDFTLRSKRTGQRGVRINAETDLDRQTRLLNSVILARRNADSSNFQWLWGVERELQRHVSVRVDYLHSYKERDVAGGDEERYTHRCRMETRIATDRVRVRSYIAFSSTSSYGDYVSLFADVKFNINEATRGEVWCNASRIARGRIDYWYMFAKLSQRLTDGYSLAAKLIHRYDRRAAMRSSNAVSLELEALW